MNAAHIHLAINHLPILLVPLGSIFMAMGLIRKSRELRASGLSLFIAAGIFALPVYFTGEPAEAIMEHHPGVSRALLHEHELAAKFAIVALEGLALLSLFWWFAGRFRREPSLPLWWGLVAVGVFSSTILIRTAFLGGQIRHEEVRSSSEARPPATQGELEDDFDDEDSGPGEGQTGI